MSQFSFTVTSCVSFNEMHRGILHNIEKKFLQLVHDYTLILQIHVILCLDI